MEVEFKKCSYDVFNGIIHIVVAKAQWEWKFLNIDNSS